MYTISSESAHWCSIQLCTLPQKDTHTDRSTSIRKNPFLASESAKTDISTNT